MLHSTDGTALGGAPAIDIARRAHVLHLAHVATMAARALDELRHGTTPAIGSRTAAKLWAVLCGAGSRGDRARDDIVDLIVFCAPMALPPDPRAPDVRMGLDPERVARHIVTSFSVVYPDLAPLLDTDVLVRAVLARLEGRDYWHIIAAIAESVDRRLTAAANVARRFRDRHPETSRPSADPRYPQCQQVDREAP